MDERPGEEARLEEGTVAAAIPIPSPEVGMSSYCGTHKGHRDGKTYPTTAAFSFAAREEEAGQSNQQMHGNEESEQDDKEKANDDIACQYTKSEQHHESSVHDEMEKQLSSQSTPTIQQHEVSNVEKTKKQLEILHETTCSQENQLACHDTNSNQQDKNESLTTMKYQLDSQDMASCQRKEDGVSSSHQQDDGKMVRKAENELSCEYTKINEQLESRIDDKAEKQAKHPAVYRIQQEQHRALTEIAKQQLESLGVPSSQQGGELDIEERVNSQNHQLAEHEAKCNEQEEDKEFKETVKLQLDCVGLQSIQQQDDGEITRKANHHAGMPKMEQPGDVEKKEGAFYPNKQLGSEDANDSHQFADELLKSIAMEQGPGADQNYAAQASTASRLLGTGSGLNYAPQASTASRLLGTQSQDNNQQAEIPPVASLPGAYIGKPGDHHRRMTKVDFSLVGADSSGEFSAVSSGGDGSEADCAELPATKENGDTNDNGRNGIAVPNSEELLLEQTLSMTDPPSSHLIIASLVRESSNKDQWPKADEVEVPQTLPGRKDRTALLPYLFGVASVVFVAVVLLLVFLRAGNSDETANGPNLERAPSSTQSESFSEEVYLLPLLPEYTVDALEDLDSPQSKALQWILQDPSFVKYTDIRLLQRFALATFFYATNGLEWEHNEGWLSYQVHECEWSFSPINQYLIEIYLAYSPELRNITLQSATFPCDLVSGQDRIYTHLWQYGNNFLGQVPEEIYLLTSMRNIAIGSGDLTGSTISTRIGTLTSLSSLTLVKLGIKGTMPTELGLLSQDLKVLMLGSNELTGTIPTELGLLPNAADIDLAHNKLAGTIPTQLGLLTAMDSLWLFINQLTGTVPTQIGQVTDLGVLMLSVNQLTGAMPTQICHMEALRLLYLNFNAFSGRLPTQVGMLNALREFGLDYNGFTGALPSEMGLLSTMVALHLDQNKFSGIIPEELGFLATNGSLMALHLNGNGFSGAIPNPLCDVGNAGECPVQPSSDCAIAFDCSAELCGCDCSCSWGII